MWTSGLRQRVYIARYRDGEWQPPDSTIGVHPSGETFGSAWCDISRDGFEKPVLVWGDLSFGLTFRDDVGSIAFPTESGWSPGEEIPGSEGMNLSPRITRDLNGDVWIGWRLKRVGLTRFTHTFVSATTSTPNVTGTGPRRAIAWLLSEPAPDSWWAVLRARNDGPFEQAARIEAGPTTVMSWIDDSPPAGVLRYRIRRESVDARYRWESEDCFWPPRSARGLMLSRASGASLTDGRLELSGADPGALEIRVFDIQGRLVLDQVGHADGTGRDTVQLDLGERTKSLPNGIYFTAVKDASGRTTNSLKLLLLR